MTMQNTVATVPIGDNMVLPKEFISETESTFQYQPNLPSMPVPPLEDTLRRYLDSVRPQVSNVDFEKTKAIVEKFASGVGKELNDKLIEKARNSRNWMEKWWDDYAYLMNREPHAPFVNFAGPGPYSHTYWPPKDGTQCERAGLIIWFTLKYWEIIRTQKLTIDRGGRTTVWCMNQVLRLFNGCKTPGMKLDKLNSYFKKDNEGPCDTHLIIFCRGRIFYLETMHRDGTFLTPLEISAQLEDIKRQAFIRGQGAEIGVLTAERRPTWTELRSHLIELHPENEEHLMAIQTSMFVVALDDRTPTNYSQIGQEGLMGDAVNRWFDKPTQYVFFSNGTMTSNGDHAACDGILPVFMLQFTYLGILVNNCQWQGRKDIQPMEKPRELCFHTDAVIEEGVKAAKRLYAMTSSQVDVHIDFFKDYGKSFLRKNKIHPDTYMQMAIQLAYYRKYKRPAATYETASARKFYHGRTETLRSCTNESVAWTKAMMDPNVQNKEKSLLLMSAMQKHLELMKEATELQGCDRHLLGLQIQALESGQPMPDLFLDPSYVKSGGSGNFILSTSFVGFSLCFGGVAPMCKDGYGVFYSIPNDRMHLFISSWSHDTDTDGVEMFANIQQSLRDMKQLFDTYEGPKL